MATETAHFAAMMRGDFQTPLDATREAEREQFALLVGRARAGDATAFEAIMSETERKVVAVAWRMLGNREDARDAAQEVYLRLYKYLDRYKPEQDFNGWLYRITVNVCRDAARKRGARPGSAQFAASDDSRERAAPVEAVSADSNAEENAIRAQQREWLMNALRTLPEKERAAIVLRDLEGLTTEEVARVLRSRPVTVRSQISSARTKLRQHCERLLQRREGRQGGERV
ncbi:MAG TPA: sigma-70 family RNA polymerase sigma factor [Pyrinomonadaceae bacterium]|nr:sigma-70 family RNA polymerase sigma factor [Pyrinomonadaceae bacterium]